MGADRFLQCLAGTGGRGMRHWDTETWAKPVTGAWAAGGTHWAPVTTKQSAGHDSDDSNNDGDNSDDDPTSVICRLITLLVTRSLYFIIVWEGILVGYTQYWGDRDEWLARYFTTILYCFILLKWLRRNTVMISEQQWWWKYNEIWVTSGKKLLKISDYFISSPPVRSDVRPHLVLLVTWPEYWPVIGQYSHHGAGLAARGAGVQTQQRRREHQSGAQLQVNTVLLLVNTGLLLVNTALPLVNAAHETSIHSSDWSFQLTWPQYWPLIGYYWPLIGWY